MHPMSKVQDLYNARIRPMVPAERLQLARLILDDLATTASDVDVSDDWSEDDTAELAAYAARQADRPANDGQGRP